MLPYMEQQALEDQWDPTGRYFEGTSRAIPTTPIPTIQCPSDTNAPFDPDDANPWWRYYRGNYACNAGTVGVQGSSSWDLTVLGSRTLGGNTIFNGGAPFIISTDGSFDYARLAELKDGTSNTLAFAECLQGQPGTDVAGESGKHDLRGAVFHAAFCWFTTWLEPNSETPDVNPDSSGCCVPEPGAPCVSATMVGGPATLTTRSRHPGGVQVALVDGSCRFITDSIDWDAWQALGTSQGGEVVPEL
jgi:prepilin-type processing-associated H-X9-DG protein